MLTIHFLYSVFIFILGACWGSFLNVVATRGMSNYSLMSPSRCPACLRYLAWYEQIPLFSWIMLRGRCATCLARISYWYPLVELITALWVLSLWYVTPTRFLPVFFILSSALIVTIRTDAEHFLILRSCSLGIIPVGIAAAYTGFLPITLYDSIFGAVGGAVYLLLLQRLFFCWKGYEGLGEGDVELLAGIGSFMGVQGVIYGMLYATLLSVAWSIVLWIISRHTTLQTPIPFGTFLALGTGIVILVR